MREQLGSNDAGPRQPVMMNWDELREMRRGGMCIGSHILSHPLLTGISREDAAVEIAASKTKIEEELNAPVSHFAYPSPGASVHVNEEVKGGWFVMRTI
jgi:peptidoglycan/xylan/chitin deacetylase (PgdA/CDA1 family)